MRILICVLAPFLLLCGCSRAVGEEAFLDGLLERERLTDSTVLILYIGEGMCAECINRELINLGEHPEIARNTLLIGVFSHKRYFLSSVSSVSVKRKVFVPADEMPEVKFASRRQPHYLLYYAPDRSFEPSYYPADCGEERTLEYYRNILPMFSAEAGRTAAPGTSR